MISNKPALLFLCSGAIALAAPPDGAALYTRSCAVCHEAGAAGIPSRDTLKTMSPASVVRTLTSGAMRFQGSYLTGAQRTALAEFITGKTVEPQAPTAGRCADAPSKRLSGPQWNGWGVDLENSRFQPASAAGMAAAEIPNLKLKWAFGFAGDAVAFAQPVVAGGRVFIGSAGGLVYSLDASSGCTYWAFDAGAGVRGAISIGPGNVAYFGDLQANMYAVDAITGKLIWKTRVDDHPVARVTGSPKLYQGRLYVPVSSHEEWTAANPLYECCTFRGSVSALDARSGKILWKTYTIADAAAPVRKNKAGVQMWGPAGAGVWSSPAIDAKLRRLYFGTGDGYTDPAPPNSDAVMALDLDTGEIAWSRQITPSDAYNVNCLQPDRSNCPEKQGPDFDFGSSPILRTLASGKRLLIIGQKSGIVYAFDPDKDGETVWKLPVGKGGILGGIQWGPAADAETAYVALSDLALQITDISKLAKGEGFQPAPNAGGGLFAIQIATGEKLWSAMPDERPCKTKGCSPAQSAAVTAIPGAVFSGSVDGHIRAYASKTGRVIWDYDTVKEYDTVNRVPARGGSIDGPGPAVADGMLFVNSGYGYFNGMPGNVLLAFGRK